MRYASGSVYEGAWAGGMQEGRGAFRFASGSGYDGEWRGGKRHGRATCCYSDGRAEVCTFKDGANDRGEGAMWSAECALSHSPSERQQRGRSECQQRRRSECHDSAARPPCDGCACAPSGMLPPARRLSRRLSSQPLVRACAYSRRVAWRIVRDGEYVEEISLEEARAVAARVGEPVPPRFSFS
jgi:hypothetical protein